MGVPLVMAAAANPTLAMIQLALSAAPLALQAYTEIRDTLSAEDQATTDALIAKVRPEALAAVAQAEADLDAEGAKG